MRHDPDLTSAIKLVVNHAVSIAQAFLDNPKANLRLFDPQFVYDFLGQIFFQIYYMKKKWIEDEKQMKLFY